MISETGPSGAILTGASTAFTSSTDRESPHELTAAGAVEVWSVGGGQDPVSTSMADVGSIVSPIGRGTGIALVTSRFSRPEAAFVAVAGSCAPT